jgi:exodeoxyribonuclease V beta subunit
MSHPTSFDLLNASLEGRQMIEASAGTGKTYTLVNLCLRLLLERGLKIEEILIVTFTEAATPGIAGPFARSPESGAELSGQRPE